MNNHKKQSGQTLITLLIFMIIAITITSTSVAILITNSASSDKLYQGDLAKYLAENGIENALLRLLRDPDYSSETLTLNEGTITITVTGTTNKTITSKGTTGNFSRTIQVQTIYNNDTYTITSWNEI